MPVEIKKVHAREILDSRGNPTVEVDLITAKGFLGRAQVPSGASTGMHEAHELRDGGKRFHGKGVQIAVDNVNKIIAPKIIGMDCCQQKALDDVLLEIDGSDNKSNLGANALLGISLAAAQAGAAESGQSLFLFLGGERAHQLPVPLMNVLNGGAHADNGLDVQEFMLAPLCGGSFSEALRAGSEIFHSLKKILSTQQLSTAVGDEGGFAPRLKNNEQALQLLSQAVEKSGYRLGEDVVFALDVAATELYADDKYNWEGNKITAAQLVDVYKSWAEKFPLFSVEDGLSEDDWSGWKTLTHECGKKVQLVGDDLFVTNPKRLQKGIESGVANALLVKVNQIGTLTETKDAMAMAQAADYKTVMSHRSGETEGAIIADLSVALCSEQIKTGSLCRGERTAKYNQLLRIEEELGSRAKFRGSSAFS